MLPHLIWLKQVGFRAAHLCRRYLCAHRPARRSIDLALGYVLHNLGAAGLAGGAGAAIALAWRPLALEGHFRVAWSRGPNSGVNISQALNVWIIQAVVAIGPPLGAVIFHVYIKTDWGISLFFLVPLALIAIPAVRMRHIALLNLTASWLVISLVILAAVAQHRRRMD